MLQRRDLRQLLILVTIVVALCTGIIWGEKASANGNKRGLKISDDLIEKAKGPQASENVTIIVQPTDSWTTDIDNAVVNYGGSAQGSFRNFKARVIRVPANAALDLASRDDIAFISLDRPVEATGHISLTTGADAARSLSNTNSSYDGSGIGIAVLDSGIFAAHDSFGNRVVASEDFTGEGRTDDPYGHGTHVAGIAAGDGSVSNGAYMGLASNANIINLRVLNSTGRGSTSSLISALDWVLSHSTTYNIRVVNLSLGTAAIESYRTDPLCLAVRRLVNAGIVVVAAAGNDGKDSDGSKLYGQIHSPGNEPSVITVGASNSRATDSRSDDVVTTYSSRGPTRSFETDSEGVRHYDNLLKPDLVAPGNKIISAKSPKNFLVTNYPSLDINENGNRKGEMYLSGTSMASPVVAGTAAMLLQAQPSLTPNLVKALLMYTAEPLSGFNHFEQGAGEVNVEGAVRLAKVVRPDLNSSTPLGDKMLTVDAPPVAQSTIAGFTFSWSQGLILDYTYATGESLITQYQRIYDLGASLSDGTLSTDEGELVPDSTRLRGGVLLGDSILTSSGHVIGEGQMFCATALLLRGGVLLGDGSLLGDGRVMSDGALASDGSSNRGGVLLGDVPKRNGVLLGDGAKNRDGVLLGDGGNRNGVLLGDGGNRSGVLLGDGGNRSGVLLGDGGSRSGVLLGDGGSRNGVLLGDGGSRSGVLLGDGGSRNGVLLGDGGMTRSGVLLGD